MNEDKNQEPCQRHGEVALPNAQGMTGRFQKVQTKELTDDEAVEHLRQVLVAARAAKCRGVVVVFEIDATAEPRTAAVVAGGSKTRLATSVAACAEVLNWASVERRLGVLNSAREFVDHVATRLLAEERRR